MATISKDFKRGTRKTELQLRIIYPKCDLPPEEKNQWVVPSPALYVPSFGASIHTYYEYNAFHPAMPGSSFLESISDVILLIKTLLFSQAEFITTFGISHCAFSDYHVTYVSCMTVHCFCVWPPSSSITAVIGAQ